MCCVCVCREHVALTDSGVSRFVLLNGFVLNHGRQFVWIVVEESTLSLSVYTHFHDWQTTSNIFFKIPFLFLSHSNTLQFFYFAQTKNSKRKKVQKQNSVFSRRCSSSLRPKSDEILKRNKTKKIHSLHTLMVTPRLKTKKNGRSQLIRTGSSEIATNTVLHLERPSWSYGHLLFSSKATHTHTHTL